MTGKSFKSAFAAGHVARERLLHVHVQMVWNTAGLKHQLFGLTTFCSLEPSVFPPEYRLPRYVSFSFSCNGEPDVESSAIGSLPQGPLNKVAPSFRRPLNVRVLLSGSDLLTISTSPFSRRYLQPFGNSLAEIRCHTYGRRATIRLYMANWR